jgi:hypothetical protein
LDRVYKASDLLLKHKDALEEHLRGTEGRLFALQEKIILYDQPIPFLRVPASLMRKHAMVGTQKRSVTIVHW